VFEICVLIFSTAMIKFFFILGGIQKDIIKNVLTSSYTVPNIVFTFNKTWIFSIDFNYTSEYKTAKKSLQWEPSCSTWTNGQTDRQTDM